MSQTLSWLSDYLNYTETQESPEVFHMWCGISLIAASVNRKVWLPRISRDGIERYRSFPGQVGIILVGGSGKAKKSTAIADIAEGILKEAGTATIYDGKITPERLLSKLGSQPNGKAIMTIIQHELTTFLSKQTYNEHMIDILTKLVDCKDDAYETQQKTYVLRDVCCTFLFGTTPRNLGEGVPPQAHDTGFMGRFFFVYGDRSGKIEPLTTTDIDPQVATKSIQLRSRLIQRLRDISKLSGPFSWTPEGKKFFDNWYLKYMNSEASDNEGWAQRKPEHILRIAMILSIAKGQHSPLILDAPDISASIVMIEQHVESTMPKSFAYIGRHANANAQQYIVDVFHSRKTKTLSGEEIAAGAGRFFSDFRAMQMALLGMRMAGIIKVSKDAKGDEHWTLLKELY